MKKEKDNSSKINNLRILSNQSGNWETWLEFFLDGIFKSAKQAIRTANLINELFEQDFEKIAFMGRIRFSCEQTLEHLKKLPQITVPLLAGELGLTAPTARSALNQLVRADILEEVSGKKRDKVYVYRKYLSLLEEGTEPLK